MPNWCANSMSMTGPESVIKEIADNFSLETFVPCPPDLKGVEKLYPPPEEEVQMRKALLDKYGVDTEFDWHVQKWGTKWEIDMGDKQVDSNEDGTFNLFTTFNSAWSPPVAAFEALYEKYKDQGLTIHWEYFEPGAMFIGTVTARKGVFRDDYHDYENADELSKLIKMLDHGLAEGEDEYLREQENSEEEESVEEEDDSSSSDEEVN